MGSSNTGRNPTEVTSSSETNAIPKVQLRKELISSFGTACVSNQDLRTFDANLQIRMNQVLGTVASGVNFRTPSGFCERDNRVLFLEMNQEVAKAILDRKKGILRNQKLLNLVKDYSVSSLDYSVSSLHSLDFFAALENCFKRVRDAQMLIFAMLHCFEEEDGEQNCRYSKTLDGLMKFKETGDPLTKELFEIFQTNHKQQKSMLEKLRIRKKKIDKKLKSIQSARKMSSTVLVVTFAAILICSVATTVVAAQPVAAALAAATTIPMDSVGKWINALRKNYENAIGSDHLNASRHLGCFLIDHLEVQIKNLLQKADLAI